MSTSLLYHAFGIRGYDHVRTDYQGGATIFTIRQDPDDCRCSACGSREVTSRGHAERQFAALPIGLGRKTTVVLPIPPPSNAEPAGAVRQVKSPLRRPQAELGWTQVLRAIRPGAVAAHDHPRRSLTSPRCPAGISRSRTSRSATCRGAGYAKPKLKHLPAPSAIDRRIRAVARGHRYLTVVMDLESERRGLRRRRQGGRRSGSPSGNGCGPAGPRSRRWPWTCRRRIGRRCRSTCPRP